jgi:hypothetical protein
LATTTTTTTASAIATHFFHRTKAANNYCTRQGRREIEREKKQTSATNIALQKKGECRIEIPQQQQQQQQQQEKKKSINP